MAILATVNSGPHQIVVSISTWSSKIKVTYDGRVMTEGYGRIFDFQVDEDNDLIQYVVEFTGVFSINMNVIFTFGKKMCFPI